MKKQLLSVVGICFFLLAGIAAEGNSSEKNLERARRYFQENQFQSAVIELRNVLEESPEDDQAYLLLGEAYIRLNDYKKAMQSLQRAEGINPSNWDALLMMGQLYLRGSDLIEARKIVTRVMEGSSEKVKAYHLLAGIQIKERNVPAAISTMEKAVSSFPQDFEANMFLAHLYDTAGQDTLAETAYLKTIALDSTLRAPYYELSKLYVRAKQWEKAEDLLKKVIQTPGIKDLKYTDLAKLYEMQRKLDLAEINYLEAIKAGPQEVQPLMNLAEFYVRVNQKDRAVEQMNKALSLKKEPARILTGLAQIHFHFKDAAKTEGYLEKALEQDKDYIPAQYLKGRLLFGEKKFSEASDVFHKILQKDPSNAGAYYYEAICIRENKNIRISGEKVAQATGGLLNSPEQFKEKLVKDYLKTAASLDPEFQDAKISLAQIYLAEKDLDKAREQIEQILSLKPKGSEVLFLISELKLLEGDWESAEKVCQIILTQDPGYGPAHIQLGLVHRAAGKKVLAKASFQKALNLHSCRKEVLEFIINLYMKDKNYADALEIVDNCNLPETGSQKALVSYLKGNVAVARKEIPAAIEYLKAAVESDPAYVPASMSLAGMYIRQKRFEQAAALYNQVLTQVPSYIPALMGLGYVYDVTGLGEKAQKQYRQVLKVNPDHVNAANNLAFILAKSKDTLGEAYSLAAQAKEKNPRNPNVLDTLGWVYYKSEKYELSVQEFKASLELFPQNASTCFHLGLAYHEINEYELSRDYLQKALDLDPSFEGAEEARMLLN